MKQKPLQQLIPSHYLVNLLDYVSAEGISVDEVLSKAGISSKVINDPEGELSLQQFADMFKYASLISKQPQLGLLLGRKLGITAHGILGYAVMSSANVSEALELVVKYFQTRTPLAALKLACGKQHSCLILTELYPLPEIQTIFIETVVSTLTTLMIFLSENNAPFTEINLNYSAPTYHSEYAISLGCQVNFDQPQISMKFDSSILERVLPHADKTANQQAITQSEKLLQTILSKQSYSLRIEKILIQSKPQFYNFEEVAEIMNSTKRTLRRRLIEEGTSFQSILEQLKYRLALQFLTHSQLSIQEISYELGYSDPSNFGRAFKKWHGGSPLEIRG